MAGRLASAAALVLLAIAGWAIFPGHTWLESDTQIYVPLFEHLKDPQTLAADPMAVRPHLKWTIYDEVTLALSGVTGLDFRRTLEAQHMAMRIAGILGAFLIGQGMGLGNAGALLVAGCFGLGATVNGPAVLTLEYEPVPRGFAVMLVVLALGLEAVGRWRLAGVAAVLATLYHPTTAFAFWVSAAPLWFKRREELRPSRVLLIAAGAGAAMLGLFALTQRGMLEQQVWWGRIPPDVEELQRMRGSYIWVAQWPAAWLWQYPLLLAIVVIAWRRLRAEMSPALRWFGMAMPLYGMAAVGASYILLDVNKWVLMPQFQPARAVLWVTAFAQLLGAGAAWTAARKQRWIEPAAWLAVVYAIPANGLVFDLFTKGWASDVGRKRLLLVVALALAASAAAWLWSKGRRWLAAPALAAVLFAPVWLLPGWAEVRGYPKLGIEGMTELCEWAKANTDRDAVFLFADANRGREPGIFRVEASRPLYVDWKGGGQVNLLVEFARDWGVRWRNVGQAQPPLRSLAMYQELGIDYIVVRPRNRPQGAKPVFANGSWEVFELKRQ